MNIPLDNPLTSIIHDYLGSALIEMHLGHCAEMAVEIERGFSGNPLKSKLISETAAAHSIRSESEIEDSATQTTSP